MTALALITMLGLGLTGSQSLIFPMPAPTGLVGGSSSRSAHREIERMLFSPEQVMRHQEAIGLTDSQRNTIKSALKQAQEAYLDAQWDMEGETRKLMELVADDRIDRAAVLRQAQKVTKLETEVKMAQLGLLVDIKNTLTAEQESQLEELDGRSLFSDLLFSRSGRSRSRWARPTPPVPRPTGPTGIR